LDTDFGTSFWGYRKDQVDEYLKRLVSDMESKIRDKESDLARKEASNEQLKLELARLTADIDKFRVRESAIAETLVQAQLQAVAIEEDAKRKAEEMRASAMAEVAVKRAEITQIKAQMAKFKADFGQMIEQYRLSIGSVDPKEPNLTSLIEGLKTGTGDLR